MYKITKKFKLLIKYSLLLLLLTPIIMIIYNSFLWFSPDWWFLLLSWFKNTLLITIWSVIISIIISLPSAVILWLYKIRFSKIFLWIFILTLVIPWYSLALIYSEYFPLFFSKIWLMIILWIASSPYLFLSIYFSIKNISYKYIITWYTLGLNDYWIIKKIILPLLTPSIIIWTLMVIAETISDFWASYFLWVKTIMVDIYQLFFQVYDKETASQFSLILILLILILYLSFKPFKNRLGRFYNNKNSNDVIGDKNTLILTKYKSLVYWYLVIISIIIFILPLTILFIWVSKVLWYNDISVIKDFFLPIKNTLLLLFLSIIIINIVWYISLKLYRKNNIILNIINVLYSLPWIIIWIWILYITPFINTYIWSLIFLILWFIIKILPLVINSLYIHYIKINNKLRKVWYSLWRWKLSYIYKVEIPLLKKWILMSSALIFIEIIRELPITLILKPFDFETLSTTIFFYQSSELIEKSSIRILTLIIFTLIPLIYIYKNKITKYDK